MEGGLRASGGRLPERLAADRAYSARRIRRHLADLGVEAVIPRRKDECARMANPSVLDRAAYRKRNAVERLVGWLKEHRAVATRYDKLAKNFLAMVHLAMIRILLKRCDSSNRT